MSIESASKSRHAAVRLLPATVQSTTRVPFGLSPPLPQPLRARARATETAIPKVPRMNIPYSPVSAGAVTEELNDARVALRAGPAERSVGNVARRSEAGNTAAALARNSRANAIGGRKGMPARCGNKTTRRDLARTSDPLPSTPRGRRNKSEG